MKHTFAMALFAVAAIMFYVTYMIAIDGIAPLKAHLFFGVSCFIAALCYVYIGLKEVMG